MKLYKIVAILFIYICCINNLYAQSSHIEASLKSKYDLVQYHNECGGWYFISDNKTGQPSYGFADKNGNVVAKDAIQYKLYPGYIELYLLNKDQKALHDQWKVDMQRYQQEYNNYLKVEKKYEADLAAYRTKYKAAESEAERIWKAEREKARKKAEYEVQKNSQSSGNVVLDILSGVAGGAAIAAAVNAVKYEPILNNVLANRDLLVAPSKPYNPRPSKPSEPSDGWYWAKFPLRQPSPYATIDYSQIQDPTGFADVSKNGKWGLVDATLQEIIACTNHEKVIQKKYSDGLYLVKSGLKYGVINPQGKFVIPVKYDQIDRANQRFLVKTSTGWGVLTTIGKKVMECKFQSIKEQHGFLLCKEGDKWGVYTNDNDELYPCQFQDVNLEINNSKYILKNKNKGLWGAIDFFSGVELFPNIYSSIEYTSVDNCNEKFYTVCRDSKYGLYSDKGIMLIPCEFSQIRPTTITGEVMFVGDGGGTIGFFQTNGISVVPHGKYKSAKFCQTYYEVTNISNLIGVCDIYGNEIVPCKYTSLEYNSDLNAFKATANGRMGFVSMQGKELFPFIIAHDINIMKSDKRFFTVKKSKYDSKSYGIIDYKGREVVPMKFAYDKVGNKINKVIKKDTIFADAFTQKRATLDYDYSAKIKTEAQTLTNRNKFSFYAQNYVERIIGEWQIKGEFEKIEDWQKRVNSSTLNQRIYTLTKEAQDLYIKEFESNRPADNLKIVGAYDPDNETYRISTDYSNEDILVKVDQKDALEFKTLFSSIKKTPKFFVDKDGIALAEYHFTMPNGNKYSYSNTASLTHSIAKVEYKLNSIDIDKSMANSNVKKGKQIFSTENILFGRSDIDTNIPISEKKRENTFAVIIANENYNNDGAVQFAYNDGMAVKDYCEKALGLPKENIHFKANATLNEIKFEANWIKTVAKAHNNANIIFYYAGHGVPDPVKKDAYLLPIDGHGSDYTTGYKLSELFTTLSSVPCENILVLLDACFSGSSREGKMIANERGVRVATRNSPKGNMVVFSATTSTQTAHPYLKQSHGLFTYYMLKWLKTNYNNISLGSWYDYIRSNVASTASKDSDILKEQHPSVAPSPELGKNWRNITL